MKLNRLFLKIGLVAFLVVGCGSLGSFFNSSNTYRSLLQESEWLNTSRPLQTEDLKDRVILLDFWTYCCINCLHVIPDLQTLEKEFGDRLLVIGVHSAKFSNEQDTTNIRASIVKYQIKHPVVNDKKFKIWKSFGANSWPTFILIDRKGDVRLVRSGEGQREILRKHIAQLLAEPGPKNQLPLPLQTEQLTAPLTKTLRFPGKIEIDSKKNKIYVSDSGHNQIVEMDTQGFISRRFGSVEGGFKDGAAKQALFKSPQGLKVFGNTLYVADTGNHAIRQINLMTGVVQTLAGKGVQGSLRIIKDIDFKQLMLASPWDLSLSSNGGELLVAMAGTHQIWRLDLKKRVANVAAGSGRESIEDGLYPLNSLSQPSGITSLNNSFYFVDSETSSLRTLNGSRVETLVGTGLFDFGFKDGKSDQALMQHPLGLAAVPSSQSVILADTYNHAIRQYDIRHKNLKTISGFAGRGFKDGDLSVAQFNEPNGVTVDGSEVVWVADTNNHLIRKVDLKTSQVSTLVVMNPPIQDAHFEYETDLPNKNEGEPNRATVGSPIKISIELPEGKKLNEQAPQQLALFNEKKQLVQGWKASEILTGKLNTKEFGAAGEFYLQGIFYYCEAKVQSTCDIQGYEQVIKVTDEPAQSSEIKILIKKIKS